MQCSWLCRALIATAGNSFSVCSASDVLSSNVEEVNIKNNIIYINNKKIALPKSNKKKAMLINKTTLLYLSDLNRGYGFYSLRKLKLKIDE